MIASTRTWLLLATLALGAQPADAFQACGQGVVTVGLEESTPGDVTSGTFNVSPAGVIFTDARRTFTEALESLPPGGGEIVVLPGTYRFESTLEIARSGVTIRGSRGVVFRSLHNHPLYGLMRVTGDDFSLIGVELEVDPTTNPPAGQSAVILEGDRAVIRDCVFRVREAGIPELDGHVLLDLVGAQHTLLRNNRFRLPATTTYGSVTPISATGATDLRISANVFGPGLCNRALDITGGRSLAIQGNAFDRVRETVPGSSMLSISGATLVVVGSNNFTACAFSRLVNLSTSNRAVVTGNQLNDLEDDGQGNNALGLLADTSRLVVDANQFRGFGDPVGPGRSIYLTGDGAPAGALIAENQFTRCRADQIIVDDYHQVSAYANHFVLDESAPSTALPLAFRQQTTTGHVPYANSASAAGATDWAPGAWEVPDPNTSFGLAEDANWQSAAHPAEPGFAYCFGDGTGTACPCGNDSTLPEQGCAHGTGPEANTGLTIRGTGTPSVIADDMTLTVENCPPATSGIFFVGTDSLGLGCTLGNGLLCVGGCIYRSPGTSSGAGGNATGRNFVALSKTHAHCGDPYFQPGSTYYFQFWMRDTPGHCGAGSVLSPGYQVTMTP